MNVKKKAIYLATRSPVPCTGGREKMIQQTIRFLQNEYDLIFVYIERKNHNSSIKIKNKFNIYKVIRLNYPSFSEILFNIFRPRFCFQEALFYSFKNHKIIKDIISKNNPYVLIVDMIRMKNYVTSNFNGLKIIEIDDLLSLRYLRFANHLTKELNIFATFTGILPNIVEKTINRFFLKYILMREAKIIKNKEIECTSKFDAVILVSKNESEQLQQLSGSKNIFNIPPCVFTIRKKNKFSLNNLLFMGNLTTNQNLSSFFYIINNILPLLRKEKITFEFRVVGIYDDRSLIIAKKYNDIKLLGFVDSIEDITDQCRLMLAPITFGTGIKLKILDALSLGLPVVTNSVGAEGLAGEAGKHYLVGNNAQVLVQQILLLCRSQEKCKELSKNAFELMKEKYHESVVQKQYMHILHHQCSRH